MKLLLRNLDGTTEEVQTSGFPEVLAHGDRFYVRAGLDWCSGMVEADHKDMIVLQAAAAGSR